MRKRTERLVEKCRIAMSAGEWWSLAQLSLVLGCSECTTSARIRDQRKSRYGGHKIIKRLRSGGYFEYRMLSEKETAHAHS